MTANASSMAVDYDRIIREIGWAYGDTDSTNWDGTFSTAVTDVLKTAMDMVIHPPAVPGFGRPLYRHEWSWLRPLWRLTTSSNQRRYTLPIDFELFVGEIQFDGEDYAYGPIPIVSANRLMQLRNDYENTGVPALAATEPIAHDGATEQRMQLVLHPTPDGSYDLIGQYQIGVHALSSTNPYPPGGPAMGQVFLAAALAAAEAKFDEDPRGAKYVEFLDRLVSAIGSDLQRQPKNLGYAANGRRRFIGGRSQARGVIDLTSGYTTYNSGTNL